MTWKFTSLAERQSRSGLAWRADTWALLNRRRRRSLAALRSADRPRIADQWGGFRLCADWRTDETVSR